VLSFGRQGLRLTELGLQSQATSGFGFRRRSTATLAHLGLHGVVSDDAETLDCACLNYSTPGDLYKYAAHDVMVQGEPGLGPQANQPPEEKSANRTPRLKNRKTRPRNSNILVEGCAIRTNEVGFYPSMKPALYDSSPLIRSLLILQVFRSQAREPPSGKRPENSHCWWQAVTPA
jgi:hypothetical protein